VLSSGHLSWNRSSFTKRCSFEELF